MGHGVASRAMRPSLLVPGVLCAALVGCGDDGDPAVANACRVFEEIAADAANGVLSASEMRERTREVYEKAQASESGDFVAAAAALHRDMLNPETGVIPAFGDECEART